MSSYQSLALNYFGLYGKGFPIRVFARASGIPFTDNRLSFEQWGPIKAEGKLAPLGQLPVLQVNGETEGYCQSIPLSCFCAKLAGCYPSDPLEQLKVDEIVATIDGKVINITIIYATRFIFAL